MKEMFQVNVIKFDKSYPTKKNTPFYLKQK